MRLTISLISLLLALGAPLAMAQDGTTEAAPQPTPPAAEPPPPTLSIEQAYQKEYAFLEAQRRELAGRIEQTRARNAQALAAAQAQVNQLQSSVVDLDAQADRLNEAVNASEELVISNEENSEVLQATFQQAAPAVRNTN